MILLYVMLDRFDVVCKEFLEVVDGVCGEVLLIGLFFWCYVVCVFWGWYDELIVGVICVVFFVV